jgi:hypothetical protein
MKIFNSKLFWLITIAFSLTSNPNLRAQQGEAQPKLYEPYAPKPSGKAPEGWEIKILEGSQVENSTLLNGKKEIKVTVPAYELVPKTNEGTLIIKDPGFDPKLATAQRDTIGAVLTEYSEKTIDLQLKLEKVIEELEVGLGSPAEGKEGENKEEVPTGKKQEQKQSKKSP